MGSAQEDDRYVTGGINWESYSLQDLVAMVADDASAPQLERLADDWRAAGTEVTDASSVLGSALEDLMQYWSGAAAEQARQDVALNARWVGDLGETAHQIGDPIQEAAGALKAAQDAMPAIPPKPPVEPALAADHADLGYNTGGNLAAAINGTAAGSESAFAAEQEAAKLKAVAVEAMRRFEGAAMGIDAATPRFAEPDTEPGTTPGTGTTPPPIQPLWPPTPYGEDGGETRWDELTADPTTPQGTQNSDTKPAGSAPAALGAGGGGGGAGLGGGFGGGGGSATSRLPQPGLATGLTEAVPQAPRPGGGLPGAAPAAASAGGPGGPNTGGMPMGGMGGGHGGGENGEHRRRYPVEGENPFAADQKASPPVIGL